MSEPSEDTSPQSDLRQSQGSRTGEGVPQAIAEILSAGISSRRRTRTMSRRMADSVSQRDFFGNAHMHYMASQAAIKGTAEDIFHDTHLELQERMGNPVAFHAEMMGDIMYLHQALQQDDASEFVKAVVQEINGHVENKHWALVERDTVPKDAQIVPSVWSLRRKRNLTTTPLPSTRPG